MGELKNEENEGTTFPPKRKPDEQDALTHSDSKKPKPEALLETKLIENQHTEDDDDEDEEEYEDTEDEDDEDEDDDEHSNGEAKIDVKGKGMMRDDKGKGKLIEESEQDDDSSDDDAINGSDDGSDSDLSDDPLAEVDLDNILPSRTRSRRGASRGVVIGNNHHKDNGDDE